MSMYRHRFYTEDKRHTSEFSNDVDKFLCEWFPMGCTITNAEGVWHGGTEMSMIIEVLDTEDDHTKFAEALKEFNKQETVLYTKEEVGFEFI